MDRGATATLKRGSTTTGTPATRPGANQALRRPRSITGPYSRLIDRGALGDISGNSREGRFLRAYERQLFEHCGGKPSITQRALISRTARLALHLELMDERALKEGRGFGPTDHHFYCVWANSLARHLAKLGFEPANGTKRQGSGGITQYLEELDGVA